MRIKSYIILLLFLTLLFEAIFTKTVFADTFTISGHVEDSSGNAVSGATISVNDANSDNTITDNSGNYSLSVPSGTYNVQVTPPPGSDFSPAISTNRTISGDTIINFIFAPAGLVALSGHVYDRNGSPLSGQHVYLVQSSSNNTHIGEITTTSDGSYSTQVLAGTYFDLVISGSNNSSSYELNHFNYSLIQNTTLDITVPIKQVTMNVQTAEGNGIQDVALTTANQGGSPWANTNLVINGVTYLAKSTATGMTDGNGNATLFLLPGNYTFIATPPSGSTYTTTPVNKTINTDTQVPITLQQPVTLSGHIYDQNGDPLSGQHIYFIKSSSDNTHIGEAISGVDGAYNSQVLAGNYFQLIISGSINASSYALYTNNYTITQNTSLDFPLPIKQVNVTVKDTLGNSAQGVRLASSYVGGSPWANTNLLLGGLTFFVQSNSNATTDGNGNATLLLFPGNYTLTATPSSDSNYTTTPVDVRVTSDTQVPITLQQLVTLNGHIYDQNGNPLSGQHIYLIQSSSNNTHIGEVTTNVDGSYSTQVLASSYFDLVISGNTNASSLYELNHFNYSLTQDTVLDVTIPVKEVNINVQNQVESGIVNVSLTTSTQGGSPWVNTNLTINGVNYLAKSNSSSTTDNNGDATLSLLAGNYTLTASPPTTSNYTATSVNTTISTDQNEVISLQYSHNPPTTTASLSPIPFFDGTYADPTTITLSATAAAGYTIANTYYKVDGGSQQTYSTPFTVTSTGEHTIEYWSVDNSGVQEAHNTKDFTIHTNQPPHVNPLNGGSINVNDTYTESGSFTDDDSTSWTATVDYGDGTGTQNLPLQADKSFTLSHQYTTAGNYTINVTVTDDQGATGTTYASVTVNNAPQVASFSDATMLSGEVYSENGSFVDSDSSSWTATVNYGDSSGDQPLTLSGKTFSLNHTYATPGSYTVTVKVTDNQGATGTGTATVTVNNRPPHVTPLNSETVNEGETFTETGAFTDTDSTTWTATVDYGDGAGEQPLTLNTDKTFSLNHTYKDNGNYTVTVVVTDNQGNTGTTMTSVIVNNVTPTVDTISVTPNPTHINSSTSASASFTDPGVLDTHTATIDWGDGSAIQNATVSETNGSGTVSGSHTYTTFGTYTITVSVRDKDNATAQKTTNLTVVKQLTALTPAKIYVSRGLPTIRLDLKAEVYKDTTLVSSGEIASVAPGVGATLESIPFNTFTPVDVPSGSALKVVVYARNACSGSILNSGTATLSYNNTSVDSSFGATIGTTSATYHLLNGFVLGTTAGNSTQTVSVQAGAQCSAFKSFGTWTVTP